MFTVITKLLLSVLCKPVHLSLTLSPPIPLRLYTLPYWSNPPFLIFDILALRTERQSARMSKIKNSGLDQYGAEPFGQQQFGTAGIERVNTPKYVELVTADRSLVVIRSLSCTCHNHNIPLTLAVTPSMGLGAKPPQNVT